MIQDIAPHIYHNEYKPVPPDAEGYVLVYKDNQILYRQEEETGELYFPCFKELEGKVKNLYLHYTYLFSVDDSRFYLVPDFDTEFLSGYAFQGLRSLRTAPDKHLAFAGVTGYQLWQWYQNRRYCGKCGKPMIHSKRERAMVCPECGRTEYPVLSPAVIVGITNGDKILLSKYSGRSFTLFALIAGFAEIGETIEETVKREVMEEVGLKVKNIRYYKSQPWSFSGTLLFGFYCDVDGSDKITVDHEELAMADWFERDKIEGQGNDASLTNEMMLTFKAGKEPK